MYFRDYLAAHDAILKLWGIEPWSGLNLWRRHSKLASALGRAPWHASGDHHKSLIAAIGTAGGKTVIAANIVNTLVRMGARVLFCADTDELVAQPLHKIFQITGLNPDLEKADSRGLGLTPICVASVQTLANSERLDEFAGRWGVPDFIIHDEAHTAPGRAAKINARFPDARILGLTATPFRANVSSLDRWYEIEAFRIEVPDLINQGWITPLSVQGIDLSIDLDQLLAAAEPSPNAAHADFRPSHVARRIEPVYRDVARILRDDFAGRAVLVFHPLIKSSKLFTEICRQEGGAAAHCDGDSKDRSQVISRFESGEIRVVSNSGVFTQGVDFIRADCLLNLALTRSAGKFRQRAGRVMRVLPGVIDRLQTAAERRTAIATSAKPDALILDLLGQSEKLRLAGAASIIAHNDTERTAITQSISRDPQRLDEIQAAVVHAREEAIIRELSHGSTRIRRDCHHGIPARPIPA
jgi:superfamily II DNA or RNA helicase